MLKSKYMYQDDDHDIQASQKGKTTSKHDEASSMHEKSEEVLIILIKKYVIGNSSYFLL